MNTKSKRRRGTVAVLVALSLTAVVGVAAIAMDGGLLQDESRRAQAAADAAALAAAIDLYNNYQTNAGLDPKPYTGSASALSNAAANGYANDGTRSIVTVNIPPLSGPYAGKASYVEVIIQYNTPRGFSNILGSGDIPVKARAVARGAWVPFADGVIILDPTDPNTLTANGGGAMTVTGANVIVDSSDYAAGGTVGNSSFIAPNFYFSGTPGYTGTFTGNIVSGAAPTPDPLAYLPEPDPAALTLEYSKNNGLHDSGNGNKTDVLNPGVFIGGIQVTGGANLFMNPGIYYMEGGGFTFSGTGSLTANGVMIYNDPLVSTDSIKITGSGSISITPPTTGIYAGISIFQDRTSTVGLTISGNGNMNITGTLYAAAANEYIGEQRVKRRWLAVYLLHAHHRRRRRPQRQL